ncbi:MAG: hypothetical protein ABIV63_14370, partial [Caldimonas sp.]
MNSLSRRRLALHLSSIALAIGTLGVAASAFAHDNDDTLRAGKVFTNTNGTGGNELMVFAPTKSGDLALVARAATNGQGTGAGLGSQGAVTLSGDGHHVFVVNAAS